MRHAGMWIGAVLLTAAAGLMMMPAPSAVACGISLPSPNRRALYVALAERALDDGDLLVASRSLVHAGQAGDDAGLELRYKTARAKLTVRGTAARRDMEPPAAASDTARQIKRQAEQQQYLGQAIHSLRAVAEARRGTPRSLTDLAEALAMSPGGRQEARAILEDLAARDLISSAEGWAALSQLRGGEDDNAAAAAVTRCMQMATNPDTCRPSPAWSAAPPAAPATPAAS